MKSYAHTENAVAEGKCSGEDTPQYPSICFFTFLKSSWMCMPRTSAAPTGTQLLQVPITLQLLPQLCWELPVQSWELINVNSALDRLTITRSHKGLVSVLTCKAGHGSGNCKCKCLFSMCVCSSELAQQVAACGMAAPAWVRL